MPATSEAPIIRTFCSTARPRSSGSAIAASGPPKRPDSAPDAEISAASLRLIRRIRATRSPSAVASTTSGASGPSEAPNASDTTPSRIARTSQVTLTGGFASGLGARFDDRVEAGQRVLEVVRTVLVVAEPDQSDQDPADDADEQHLPGAVAGEPRVGPVPEQVLGPPDHVEVHPGQHADRAAPSTSASQSRPRHRLRLGAIHRRRSPDSAQLTPGSTEHGRERDPPGAPRQAGVVSRRQVLDNGGTDVDIERLLRRRRWATVHRGVSSTTPGRSRGTSAPGPPCCHAPAVLAGRAAMRAHRMRVVPAIAPDASRSRSPSTVIAGVGSTRGSPGPPGQGPGSDQPARARGHHGFASSTRCCVAASEARSDDAAVAVVADACQEGRSTLQSTGDRTASCIPELRHRALLEVVLGDVDVGVRSALERRYLRHVERAHGLPPAKRQSRAAMPAYRDVRYPAQRLVVELDGRMVHDPAQARWADLDRDLATAADGDITVRIAWRTRCSSPAALPRRLRDFSSAAGGPDARRPAARAAESSTMESFRHQVPTDLHRCPTRREPGRPPEADGPVQQAELSPCAW